MTITPRVIDIYRGDRITNFADIAAGGVWGVIHKASEGSAFIDRAYADRKVLAESAGLLWGAYHFNTGEDVNLQVKNFIQAATPDDNTLMVLDFEDNVHSPMSIHQAVDFLKALEDKIGREAAIYSGNKLKETIGDLNDVDANYIKSKRLWLCQYGPHAVLPDGFDKYWLWQYTGDGVGPSPHTVKGIFNSGNTDLNIYDGTLEQLKAEWAGKSLVNKVSTIVTPPVVVAQPEVVVADPAASANVAEPTLVETIVEKTTDLANEITSSV